MKLKPEQVADLSALYEKFTELYVRDMEYQITRWGEQDFYPTLTLYGLEGVEGEEQLGNVETALDGVTSFRTFKGGAALCETLLTKY